uniref:Uncharacterized protein n=1 Tax=Arundo donax TaxID=35708 RepID=A0A0A9AKC5_ARUDO
MPIGRLHYLRYAASLRLGPSAIHRHQLIHN